MEGYLLTFMSTCLWISLLEMTSKRQITQEIHDHFMVLFEAQLVKVNILRGVRLQAPKASIYQKILPYLLMSSWIRCVLPLRSFNGRFVGKYAGHWPSRSWVLELWCEFFSMTSVQQWGEVSLSKLLASIQKRCLIQLSRPLQMWRSSRSSPSSSWD